MMQGQQDADKAFQNADRPLARQRLPRGPAEEFIQAPGRDELTEAQLMALHKKFRCKRDLYTYMDMHRKCWLRPWRPPRPHSAWMPVRATAAAYPLTLASPSYVCP